MTMRCDDDDTTTPWELDRRGYHRIRIRCGRREQLRVTIATTDRRVARERLARLREVSARLTGQGLTVEAAVALKKAASQEDALRFELMVEAALALSPEPASARRATWDTFAELAAAWVSGALHRRWPDHVGAKRSATDDKARLDYLCELVVDERGRRLGDMPLDEITVEHVTAAMRQLPASARRPATRRHYAQVIGRVLKLAAFPVGRIAASPLPRNFLPAVPAGDLLFPHFYPDEDLRLMRCASLEYGWRVLFGLCNREGGRLGEFLRRLKWSMIDERRGLLRLPGGMSRKNGKPSEWQAEPGSIEALAPLRELGLEGPFFHLPADRKWAARLHAMMRAASLDREALYYSNVDEGIRRMRGHDTRATYVTLALACGLTETHIMDRTGHSTSSMVHRYDRSARALAASDIGARLMPLDVALGLGGGALPAPRRAGWMTLDPRSAEAVALERVVAALGRVAALGEGGGGAGGGAVVDGELVDDDLGELGELGELGAGGALGGGGPGRRLGGGGAVESAPAGGSGGASGDVGPAPCGGVETEVETNSTVGGSFHALQNSKSSMFSAAVREPGVEPGSLAAPEPKSVPTTPDAAPVAASVRNHAGQIDESARSVSTPPGGWRQGPEAEDPVAARLRALAHDAVERGDVAAVGALLAALEAHRRAARGAA